MNKTEANREAKNIYKKWQQMREQIEKEAKENGTWKNAGLDSNNHLFESIDAEAKEKIKNLSSLIDEE